MGLISSLILIQGVTCPSSFLIDMHQAGPFSENQKIIPARVDVNYHFVQVGHIGRGRMIHIVEMVSLLQWTVPMRMMESLKFNGFKNLGSQNHS